MKSTKGKYKIKSATGMDSVVLMVIAVAAVGDLMVRYAADRGLMFYFAVLVLLYCLWLLGLAAVRVFSKAGELSLDKHALTARGATLQAAEIEAIYVTGLSKKLIGIRPKGKRIVPLKLGFKFAEAEDEAVKGLADWAEAHEVPLEDKKFFKWI